MYPSRISKLTTNQLSQFEHIAGMNRGQWCQWGSHLHGAWFFENMGALEFAKSTAVMSLMSVFAEEYVNYQPAHGSATFDLFQRQGASNSSRWFCCRFEVLCSCVHELVGKLWASGDMYKVEPQGIFLGLYRHLASSIYPIPSKPYSIYRIIFKLAPFSPNFTGNFCRSCHDHLSHYSPSPISMKWGWASTHQLFLGTVWVPFGLDS